MPTLKHELTQNDLKVLAYYAQEGMRERYWNYLANPTEERVKDNGYGLLALSVVRNDAMPGKIANNYAQNYVQSHPVNGKSILSEQEWDKVGKDLIKADFAIRADLLLYQKKADLALNLTVDMVYGSHIKAFNDKSYQAG
jgi:hypothetical protein